MHKTHSGVKVSLLAGVLMGAGFAAQADDKPAIKPLINSSMTGVKDHTMLMSEVYIPAHTTMPRHTHPVEEFLYILSGRAKLVMDGHEDRWLKAGDAVVIPAGIVHTAVTEDASTKAITTRVHPSGQPVRTLANSPD